MIEYVRNDTHFIDWWTSFFQSIDAKAATPPVVDKNRFPILALMAENEDGPVIPIFEEEDEDEMPPVSLFFFLLNHRLVIT